MSLRVLRIISRDIRGTALVEGAVMLPMLFVFFFGVFEFSWYFYEQHRVSTGIRDAARYIARSENLDWTALPSPPTVPDPPIADAARNLATTGDPSGVCVLGTEPACRVAAWTSGAVQIQTTSQPCITICQGGAPSVYDVLVSTSFTPNSLGFLGFLKLGPFTVNVSHYERLPTPIGSF